MSSFHLGITAFNRDGHGDLSQVPAPGRLNFDRILFFFQLSISKHISTDLAWMTLVISKGGICDMIGLSGWMCDRRHYV